MEVFSSRSILFSQETVEKPAHVTREIFGADTGGGRKEHPVKGL
jgi:hypothetical protein